MRMIKRLQVGKNGLSEGFFGQLKNFFESEKIVKVAFLKSACRNKAEAKEMAEKMVSFLGENFNYRLVGYVATIRKFRKKQNKKPSPNLSPRHLKKFNSPARIRTWVTGTKTLYP